MLKQKTYRTFSNKNIKNRRKANYSYQKIYLINIIFIILLIFFIGFFTGRLAFVSRASENLKNITYTSIKIKNGDTLENIARQYNNTHYSDKQFIKNLKHINKLVDDKIYSGSYLVIEQIK